MNAGVPLTREALELLDAALGIITAREVLQIVTDHLIQAFAHGFRFLSGAFHNLLVDRQSNIHGHSIRAHVLRVNKTVGDESTYSDELTKAIP